MTIIKRRRAFIVDKVKKSQTSDLKYISEERKKEVEQVFKTLNLMNQKNSSNYLFSSDGYNMPFKQFSVLKTEGLRFKTTSSSN